jgi:hypothetical protein
MPSIAVKKSKQSGAAVVRKMKNYNNEPAFVKKAEHAAAAIKKHGLPKSFSRKKK